MVYKTEKSRILEILKDIQDHHNWTQVGNLLLVRRAVDRVFTSSITYGRGEVQEAMTDGYLTVRNNRVELTRTGHTILQGGHPSTQAEVDDLIDYLTELLGCLPYEIHISKEKIQTLIHSCRSLSGILTPKKDIMWNITTITYRGVLLKESE